jgi:DNA-binding NarL/FixJ family response regulator
VTSRPARLLVAAEYALFRNALQAALEAEGEFRVVAEAQDGAGLLDQTRAAKPDLVLLDAGLPQGDALERCAQLKDEVPSVPVLVLSAAPDPHLLLAAVRAGADGFVATELELAELVRAVRRVLGGEVFVPSAMLSTLLRGLVRHNRDADHFLQLSLKLTRREREVLELLVDGCDHEGVAEILVISPQTARTHIQNIIGKLGAHSRLEAVALTVEHRLLEHGQRVGRRVGSHRRLGR